MALFTAEPAFSERRFAVSDDGVAITYGQLDAYAAEFGACLGGRELGFLLCENIPGVAASYLACLQTGNVPLLLDAHINPELLEQLLALYHPSWVLLPDDLAVPAGLGPTEPLLRRFGCTLLRRTGVQSPSLHPELALLLTTSGSTGSPKLVRQTRANIEANAASIAEYLELDGDQRPITTLPMSYTYGLSIVQSHALVGATLLMTRCTVLEAGFWRFFRQEGATSLAGVPYTYQMFHRLKIEDMELPSLQYLTQAGGKLPEALHRQFAQWCAGTGRRFYIMYGQTEATARMAYLPYARSLEKCGSIGVAIPGGRFTLEDEAGVPVPTGAVGELIYHGPNVTMGYALCADDLALPDPWQGVLRTGDMARQDEDGYFYVVGRKKRFIKIFGNRVGLDEAERLLAARFPDTEFACTGRDDLLCIFTTSRDPALPEAASAHLSELMHLARRCFDVRVIDEIPKNEAGKIRYVDLKP